MSGPSAPAHHSAPAALNEKEDAGGQKTYEETELHTGFARQGGGKAGMSLSTFVSRMC